ncbi:D-glycerate dehydrogenase [Altererythrobacter sp.]|uniref:2-hydroxyacid dehydrogenase n=1 Tax=Altererythrobacter sp. TaxID=1872480 RepID=UPI001B153730|nr:D-glycerate dehydrogenase [Altererythrobacter sp.]MBO6608239.1 D-glycerate dehydrogenase [Altererythrobacter sp.]MBO6641505.1 D-glycerate dehydrogenase [Altererythrobacter sp.]MBO6707796.1 D-glycerate dehydrogenase [Altererythrobacter sp.]MBO6946072.1 D-glycerate dehydrogenase [Altererythrobacter sp.]
MSINASEISKPIDHTPRVIVTRQLMPSVEARMEELFDVELNPSDAPFSRGDLIRAMQSADVLVPTVTDTIDAEMIGQAGDQLKLIASFGSGTDHIDLAAARDAKIIVTNTPGVFTDDTADIAMAGIIGVPRRIREGVGLVRSGKWTGWAPSGMLGRKLGGKVLGIIGMGRIGQAVAHRARAFGMEIAYFNRKRLPEAVERMLAARFVADLDSLVGEADVLTLHCPMTDETRGMIDARRIALMKPGSAIINTARGELIDQEALIEALETGHLAGAGLDVYPDEPNVDRRLLKIPNVMTLPHIGSATAEGREASGEKVIANIRFWMDGHRPPDQVLIGL